MPLDHPHRRFTDVPEASLAERPTMSVLAARSVSGESPAGRSTLGGPLEEALRYLARAARCASVLLLDLARQPRLVATSGPTLDDLGIGIAARALRQREPLWIANGTAADVSVQGAGAVALLPLAPEPSHSALMLVLARDAAAEWDRETREMIAGFLPVISSLVAAAGNDSGPSLVRGQQALLDTISDLPWMKDVHGRFVAVNHALAAMVGRTVEEMIGTTDHDYVILDAHGTPAGLRGVLIDVSARKESEDRLRASEQHFRELADVTPVMIWTTSAAGEVEFNNHRLRDFAGIGSDAQVTDELWVGRLHPDDRERVRRALWFAHEQQTWLSLETRYQRHDGEYRVLLVEAAPRYGSDGRFHGFVGSCVDITDRERLERRLDEERQLESLGHLTATIAHEMNNVLMAIQPFADIIRCAPSASVLERCGDQISNAVQRGRRITHEILRFANTSEPVREPLDVQTWLDGISDELRAALGPNIQLQIDVREPARMLADNHQMTQVLTNLAANARDAMAGTGRFTICARLERKWPGLPPESAPFIHLIVSDTGPGIAPHLLGRLFEPLFTTKTTGTGLGLPVVRDVVRRHRGDVVVDSPPGGGAVFHLIVPATNLEPKHRQRRADALPPSVRRVLLVEDDETVAAGITAVLEIAGTSVEVVSCGANAVAAIDRFQPDVVVLDIGLPDIPGTVVLQNIRAVRPDLPVLISTGHAGELQEEMQRWSGPTAQLLKPYDFSTLVSTIRRLVEAEEAS